MKSRRQKHALKWRWSCPPGFPGDLAGVMRVHDGRRVHRGAPAASPVGAAAADEDDEEQEETQADRRASPRTQRALHCSRELPHLLRQEGDHPLRRKRGEERRRAVPRRRRRRVARWNLEVVATFRGWRLATDLHRSKSRPHQSERHALARTTFEHQRQTAKAVVGTVRRRTLCLCTTEATWQTTIACSRVSRYPKPSDPEYGILIARHSSLTVYERS